MTWRERLRQRAPELAVEAASVVFAVVAALAVDEWRDDRQNLELAERARASVLEEVRANLGELEESLEDHHALAARIDSALTVIEERPLGGFEIDFEFSLLSTAAWQTAQMTRAAHFLEYGWVTRVARLYDLQSLYDDRQYDTLDLIATFGEGWERDTAGALRGFRQRLAIVVSLQTGLMDAARQVLEEPGA